MYDERFKGLKESISKHERLSGLYVFVCANDKFVPYQYLKAMTDDDSVVEERYDSIESLCDAVSDDAFGYVADVNVVVTDKVSLTERQYGLLSNSKSLCVIMCESFSFDFDDTEDKDGCVYEFGKLEKWMVSDYVKSICKGFSEDDAKALCEACEYEPFLTENEANKLSFIDVPSQSKTLHDMIQLGQIGRKTDVTPFKFVNSVVKNDRQSTLQEMGEYVDNMKKGDIFGFITLLRNNFRDVASIQLDSTATAQKLGISDKKFAALRYSKNKYSDKDLVGILTDLSNIDYLVKTGRLEMGEDRILDYVVCTTMGR